MDEATVSMVIAVGVMLMTLVSMVGTSVWVVAGLKGSIRELTVAVKEAASDIEKQTSHIESTAARVNDHETRIAVIEIGASQ